MNLKKLMKLLRKCRTPSKRGKSLFKLDPSSMILNSSGNCYYVYCQNLLPFYKKKKWKSKKLFVPSARNNSQKTTPLVYSLCAATPSAKNASVPSFLTKKQHPTNIRSSVLLTRRQERFPIPLLLASPKTSPSSIWLSRKKKLVCKKIGFLALLTSSRWTPANPSISYRICSKISKNLPKTFHMKAKY